MTAFIGNVGPWEVLIILLIALIVVGPGKLPDVAKGLGKALNDFKKASSGIRQEIQEAINLDDPPVKTTKPALEIPEYQRLQNEAEDMTAQMETAAGESETEAIDKNNV